MQKVVPAILTDSVEDLENKLQVLKGESEWIHIDIMDGEFVPNQSFDLKEWGGTESYSIEVHLMVKNPLQYLEDCKRIGADRVLIHAEIENYSNAIERMKEYEFEIGLVLNVGTPVEVLSASSGDIDTIMLMSVHPGFQGQPFLPEALSSAREVKERFPDLALGMDGGISKDNIKEVFDTGVDYIIIGSKVISSEDPVYVLRSVQEMVQ